METRKKNKINLTEDGLAPLKGYLALEGSQPLPRVEMTQVTL